MKELKDIVLKKGDVITYTYGEGQVGYIGDGTTLKEYFKGISKQFEDIVKIERPVKYETIYEAPKQILDKEEKEYLETFLRPFNSVVEYIKKEFNGDKTREHLFIRYNEYFICLPYFEKNTMYKGMELGKEYTLKELGLFE